MCKHNKNKTNWIKELVNIIIGGALIGLFSLFFLPPIAIQYWWLVWLVSSISILLWRLFKKSRTLAKRNE
jgi:cell division protein FtsW (lipid II flippase)